jgi:transcriptional regulator with XRE-family HTH domain
MESVRIFRKRLKLTQAELAARCGGCHTSTISHIERHREVPSLVMFAHLVRELQVPTGKVVPLLNALATLPSSRRTARGELRDAAPTNDAVTDLRKERERRKKLDH